VEVDIDELLGDGADDVEVSPYFGGELSEVHLDQNLVDVVEVLEWYDLEEVPLAALAIDLQGDVLASQVVVLQQIFEGVDSVLIVFLSSITHTHFFKVVKSFVTHADGGLSVITIVLKVRNPKLCRQLASEVIEAVDADIDEGLRFIKEIVADDVGPIVRHSVWVVAVIVVAGKLAVGVLSGVKSTL
jgi:hypothetical protein